MTKQGGSSSASKSIEAMRELTKVSNALQKRQRAQCMQYYGPGPYVVQFSLAVPEIENIVLRLEFPNVRRQTTGRKLYWAKDAIQKEAHARGAVQIVRAVDAMQSNMKFKQRRRGALALRIGL